MRPLPPLALLCAALAACTLDPVAPVAGDGPGSTGGAGTGGDAGTSGAAGITGDGGATGDSGSGAAGSTGDAAATADAAGSTGAAGATGDGGSTGDASATGDAGMTGARADGGPSDGGDVCAALEIEYAGALALARQCDPRLDREQCQQEADLTLECPGCKTWVDDTTMIDAVRQRWKEAGCDELPHACPAVFCPAPGVGACGAQANGAGICLGFPSASGP